MSWIKSASKFLDELDNEAGQVAKESNTSGGVLGRAKLEVVKTLAIVEDQGIFEESDEESDKASSGANPDLATMAPLPPPPEAAVRFKPTLPSAAKPAPVAADKRQIEFRSKALFRAARITRCSFIVGNCRLVGFINFFIAK